MTDYQRLYKEYQQENPDKPLGFSTFKANLRIKNKQERHEKSRDLTAKKLQYWKKKCDKLKDEIAELKSQHQLTIKQLKKDRVVKKIVQNVTKVECVGCKTLKRALEKPLDAKGERALELMKYLISVRSVLYDDGQELSETDLVILAYSKLNEYFTKSDLINTFNLGKAYSFKVLTKLRKLGYISNMSDAYLGGKKQVGKYFLSLKGEEKLNQLLNKLGRRHLILNGTYEQIEKTKQLNKK